jgi:CubicO group peptidase (beta-lactamase class C family)
MLISRRAFTGGALGAAVALQLPGRARAERVAALGPAIDAIGAYAEAHRRYFNLPGLTLGLSLPDGTGKTLNFGYANADVRTPITDETLFQIGSISKAMTATVLHQFVAEGRLRLTDRVSDLLPAIPLPAGNAIQVQHLLDHVAGLPADAPVFPDGGLWTAYGAGEHWHYSNTGYAILGKLAEHVGGKPLARLLEERVFFPLGMRRTRGAIIGEDRARYAQGYEAADEIIPAPRGVPLAPAGWVDVTFGAGSVASTAEDMNRFMRSLADAAQGRGGLGLPPPQAQAFTTHVVPSDTPLMSYGNGLMHVGNAGRSYLHHTGGMVSFSSSFHLDVSSGVGAYASSNVSAFFEYRPLLLTLFATDALTNALAGRPPPVALPLPVPLANATAYIGRYSGPAGAFEVRAGNPLTIVANGQSAELQPVGGELFRTAHPTFRKFSLMFERRGPAIVGASWGPSSYLRAGAGGQLPASSPELGKLAGRYVNDSPWLGINFVVERDGKLWLGTEVAMSRIGNNLWRIGEDRWSPERGSFSDTIDGRPQTFIWSGEKFHRHDV